jgi:uncharacterized protein (TIGR00296 family)
MVTDAEGRLAVELARASIREHLKGHARDPTSGAYPADTAPFSAVFRERRGVFVTLTRSGSGDLRGCIGFPLPYFALMEGVARAAVAAASEDPRFPPVDREEFATLAVEVSLLSIPRPLSAAPREAVPEAIRVGRDGLIVDGFGASGLLLPQVAVELGWDARTFLDQTCVKAGLAPDAWLDPRTTVRSFEAEVFHETSPGGPVVRVMLAPNAKVSGTAARRT